MPAALAKIVVLLVHEGKYLIGLHAAERLEQRGIMEWQVIAAMDHAKVLAERGDAEPHPVVDFEILLPDGTSVKAVWAHLRKSQVAKLVTVHYFDEE